MSNENQLPRLWVKPFRREGKKRPGHVSSPAVGLQVLRRCVPTSAMSTDSTRQGGKHEWQPENKRAHSRGKTDFPGKWQLEG